MKNKLLLSFVIGCQAVAAQKQPNIIVFLVDDMGLMDTSVPFITDSQGNVQRQPLNDFYRTPNMERLAQQGIRFSTFYAQSLSSPSRACIMTGQNAARHGITTYINPEQNNRGDFGPLDWNWDGLRRKDFTLPRLLKSNGYKTIHVGKAHFGHWGAEAEFPEAIGFDVNIAGSGAGRPGSYLAEDGYGYSGGERTRAVPGLAKYHGTHTFLTEAITIEAKEQLRQVAAEQRPFFLYFAQFAVHFPLNVDDRFIDHYKDSGQSKKVNAFAALIEGMDKSLGDIINYLEELKIAENTLIFFVGDNGSASLIGEARGHGSSAPLRGMKGTEFEGGFRVPFIASWAKPTKANQRLLPIQQGGVQTQFGQLADLLPTIASITHSQIPDSAIIDGQDLSLLLTGAKDPNHSDIFLMHYPHKSRGSYYTSFRRGDYKIVYYYNPEHPETPSCVLYNLKDDPFENHNIAGQKPEIVRQLISQMAAELEAKEARYPIDKWKHSLKPKPELF